MAPVSVMGQTATGETPVQHHGQPPTPLPRACKRLVPQIALVLSALVIAVTACSMDNHQDLPRNMKLKAFQPHRPDFTCMHEADQVPTITPKAQQLFDQAQAAIYRGKFKAQRDYPLAVKLWAQAAELGHWKATLNLVNAKMYGRGTERDTEGAITLLEQAMQQGIPSAYYFMGLYHLEGRGVNQGRGYAFIQLAADMGSAGAQDYIGEQINARYDDLKRGWWGNRKVALLMLNCAFAQGDIKAAFSLGQTLKLLDPQDGGDKAKALQVLHQGVKWGCGDCASYLFTSFDNGDGIANRVKSPDRAERYRLLGEALLRNPDLRLPNLDKVLPLPPAPLPMWDGKVESLIQAAQAVASAADTPPWQEQEKVPFPPNPEYFGVIDPFGDVTIAGRPGYWWARVKAGAPPEIAERVAAAFKGVGLQYFTEEQPHIPQVPLPGGRPWDTAHLRAVEWAYVAFQLPPLKMVTVTDTNCRVQSGAAIAVGEVPAQTCTVGTPCPSSGVWTARVPKEHPQANSFNTWNQQAYVNQGEPMPHPQAAYTNGLPKDAQIAAKDITWHFKGQPNREHQGLLHIQPPQVMSA